MPDLITADPRCALEPGRDVVHCASMALAWQQLVARFGALRMDPQPALADALNEPLDPACIDAGACVAMAGFGREAILERLRAELSVFFPSFSPTLLPSSLADDGLLAYAYLARALPFRVAFRPMEGTFAGHNVAAFGVEGFYPAGEEMRRQVRVHDYAAVDDFVLELTPDTRGERIVVAPSPRRGTLAELTAHVIGRFDRLRGDQAALGPIESFSMPCVALDGQASFEELKHRPLRNASLEGTAFDEVRQRIRFSLDERGAKLSSEAVVVAFGGPPPRSLHVRTPFLVMLLREGSSTPYLSVRVETTAWMQERGEQLPPSPGFGGFGSPPFGFVVPRS